VLLGVHQHEARAFHSLLQEVAVALDPAEVERDVAPLVASAANVKPQRVRT